MNKGKEELQSMRLVQGTNEGLMPYQLTHFFKDTSEINFAIQQMNKYKAGWQVRENKDGEVALYSEYPKNYLNKKLADDSEKVKRIF